jgi:hypothetical protein
MLGDHMQVDRREFFVRLRHLSVTDAWRMVREFDRDQRGRVRRICHKVLIDGVRVTVAEEQYPASGSASFHLHEQMIAFEARSRQGVRSLAQRWAPTCPNPLLSLRDPLSLDRGSTSSVPDSRLRSQAGQRGQATAMISLHIRGGAPPPVPSSIFAGQAIG